MYLEAASLEERERGHPGSAFCRNYQYSREDHAEADKNLLK